MKLESRKINKEQISNSLSLLFLGTSVLVLIYATFYSFRYTFNSDQASFMIFAEQARVEKSMFPSNFFYPNGDILTFSSSLVTMVLLFVFPVGYTTFGFSAFIIAITILLLTYKLTYVLTSNIILSRITGAFVISGMSATISDLLFGQGYGPQLIILMSSLIIFVSALEKFFQADKRWRKGIFLSGLVLSVNAFSNPQRGIIQFVPMLIAILYILQLKRADNSLKMRTSLEVFFLFLVPGFVAVFLRELVASNLTFISGVSGASFTQPGAISSNLLRLIDGFVYVFGLNGPAGAPLLSIFTPIVFIKFILITYLLKISFDQLHLPSQLNLKLYIVSKILVWSILIGLYFLIFTDLNNGLFAFRYILLSIILVFIFGAAGFYLGGKSRIILISTLVSLSILAMISNISQEKENYFDDMRTIESLRQYEGVQILTSYWTSSKLQVLSSNKLKFSTVKLSDSNCVEPYNWLNVPFQIDIDNSLLLISSDEFNLLKTNPACQKWLNYSDNEVKFPKYIVR